MRAFRVLVLVAALVVSACVSPAAVNAVRDGIAINAGHAADQGLPQPAREIAQDNHDLLCEVLYNLDGTPLPPDVQARRQARADGVAPVATGGGR